jgi:hypothetical protein
MNELNQTIAEVVSRRRTLGVNDVRGLLPAVLSLHPDADVQLVEHLIVEYMITRDQRTPLFHLARRMTKN